MYACQYLILTICCVVQVGALAQSSEAAKVFKESFMAVKDTLVTVANMVIPPPGGQIVAAAFVMAAMVIKVCDECIKAYD